MKSIKETQKEKKKNIPNIYPFLVDYYFMQTLNAVVFDNDFDDIGVCGKKSPINENRLVGIVDIVED